MKSYYFDYNATTPLAPAVREAMEPFLSTHFANPSSIHHLGRAVRQALRNARRQAAALLDASDENEILFTSGGTESNNAAIRSALALSGKKEVVTSTVEHSSVRKLCLQLEKEGYRVRWVGVDSQGRLDLEELRHAVTDQTAVVSLMMANNETGVLFPIEEAGRIAKERGAFFHVDGVQAAGKYPLNLKNVFLDFFSLSAHKFYGPKGIGALYCRTGTPFHPLIFGGAQERGRRGGTENVTGIVGLGAASEFVRKDLTEHAADIKKLRDHFEKEVGRRISGVAVSGGEAERISNTSNLHFDSVDSETLLISLDQKGICVSSGSACMSGSPEPSHVLKAMGFSDEEANSAIRFSFGLMTTPEEIEFLIASLSEAIARLRNLDVSKQHSHLRLAQ